MSGRTFETLILDWSGTLVDDLRAVLSGTNEALRRFGAEPVSLAEFRREFDLPPRRFYDRRAPGAPFAELDAAFLEGFERERASVRPLDRAASFLDGARSGGFRLRVLTALDEANLEEQMSAFGWADRFERLHAGVHDKVAYLHEVVERDGLDADRTMYVGDLPHDIRAGRRAGVATCAVLSGYADEPRLAAAEPDYVVTCVGSLIRAFAAPS